MMHPKVTHIFEAECIKKPRGHKRLDGYELGVSYKTHFVKDDITKYVRLFPSRDDNEYEPCTVRTFYEYFKVSKVNNDN